MQANVVGGGTSQHSCIETPRQQEGTQQPDALLLLFVLPANFPFRQSWPNQAGLWLMNGHVSICISLTYTTAIMQCIRRLCNAIWKQKIYVYHCCIITISRLTIKVLHFGMFHTFYIHIYRLHAFGYSSLKQLILVKLRWLHLRA